MRSSCDMLARKSLFASLARSAAWHRYLKLRGPLGDLRFEIGVLALQRLFQSS